MPIKNALLSTVYTRFMLGYNVRHNKDKERFMALKKNLAPGKYGILPVFAPVFMAQYFFYFAGKPVIAVIFLALAAAAAFILRRDAGLTAVQFGPRAEKALFALMLCCAVFMRFYSISTVPSGCSADEAQNVFDAMDITRGSLPVYIGFSTHNAALFLYPVSSFFKIAGADCVQLRCMAAFFGFLSVPALYFLLRRTLGVNAALFGGFVLAFLRWHVNFSRIGYHASFALLVFILLLYFLWKAWQDNKLSSFLLSGFLLGLSQHTYQSARLIPVWLTALFLVCLALSRAFINKNAVKITAALLLSIITALPVIAFALQKPSVFFQRQSEVSIFTKEAVEGTRIYHNLPAETDTGRLIIENFRKTLLMFQYLGDKNPKHNIPGKPVLDFVTGAFFMAGLLMALLRFKEPKNVFFLLLFLLFIIPGFITIEAPQSLRLFFLVPAVIYFCGLSFVTLASFAVSLPRYAKAGLAAALCLMPAVSAVENYGLYFNTQAKNPYCWHEFAADAWTAGMFVREKGPSWKAVAHVEQYKKRVFSLAAYGDNSQRFTPFAMDKSLPMKDYDGNLVYMLTPHYLPLIDAVLKRMYPKGELLPFYNKYAPSWMLYYAYVVFGWHMKENPAQGFDRHGLVFKRWQNAKFAGEPSSVGRVPVVLLDPDYGDLSYEWTGKLLVTARGKHSFLLKSRGKSALFIDNKVVVLNEGSPRQPLSRQGNAVLNPGYHDIRVIYSQEKTFAALELRWSQPVGGDELIPVDRFTFGQ